MAPGMLNIVNEPIVSSDGIIFSTYKIKLGLMKQFGKPLNINDLSFHRIVPVFPVLFKGRYTSDFFFFEMRNVQED